MKLFGFLTGLGEDFCLLFFPRLFTQPPTQNSYWAELKCEIDTSQRAFGLDVSTDKGWDKQQTQLPNPNRSFSGARQELQRVLQTGCAPLERGLSKYWVISWLTGPSNCIKECYSSAPLTEDPAERLVSGTDPAVGNFLCSHKGKKKPFWWCW